jgi:hypothetical protein
MSDFDLSNYISPRDEGIFSHVVKLNKTMPTDNPLGGAADETADEISTDIATETPADTSDEAQMDTSDETQDETTGEKLMDTSDETSGEKLMDTSDETTDETSDEVPKKTGKVVTKILADVGLETLIEVAIGADERPPEKIANDVGETTGDDRDETTGDDRDETTGDDQDETTGDALDETTGDVLDETTGDDQDEATGDDQDEVIVTGSGEKMAAGGWYEFLANWGDAADESATKLTNRDILKILKSGSGTEDDESDTPAQNFEIIKELKPAKIVKMLLGELKTSMDAKSYDTSKFSELDEIDFITLDDFNTAIEILQQMTKKVTGSEKILQVIDIKIPPFSINKKDNVFKMIHHNKHYFEVLEQIQIIFARKIIELKSTIDK